MKPRRKPPIKFWHRRRVRKWLHFAIVTIIVVAGSAYVYSQLRPEPKAKPQVTSSPKRTSTQSQPFAFGMAMGDTLPGLSQSQRLALLKQIKQAGFSEVRINIDWSVIQPKDSSQYSWGSTDAILSDIHASGLNVIAILMRAPVWARHTECKTSSACAPNDMAPFATFSARAVSRYASQYPNIRAWEVWNEPNILNFWEPRPNPNEYSHMLSATYPAIKQANPNAVVLLGGLSGDSVDLNGSNYVDPRSFLAQIYAAQAGKYFDGVAYHPYTAKLPSVDNPYNGWYKLATGDYTLRSVMVKNGDAAKDVWLTELGMATGGSGQQSDINSDSSNSKVDHVSADDENTIASQILTDIKQYPWIRNLDWYTFKDNYAASTNSGAAYGVMTVDGKPKPVLETLQAAMKDYKQQ